MARALRSEIAISVVAEVGELRRDGDREADPRLVEEVVDVTVVDADVDVDVDANVGRSGEPASAWSRVAHPTASDGGLERRDRAAMGTCCRPHETCVPLDDAEPGQVVLQVDHFRRPDHVTAQQRSNDGCGRGVTVVPPPPSWSRQPGADDVDGCVR